ncbi:DUF1616 domain-containing protein (plasmid) [Halolamina sp. CBA1230]|uniref:DUF1616 domain-containing protein n=1 Tax=Halolamina sp. CBA1230 TaxID=1853690 RepID=UPI0009A19504|nr:DUF1616 domain-containing protein [Halolamina sp. CBA1230]QKY21982.1 DUF1616 domain-containing protein [Halolamina sp. CBA1230]
MSTNDGTALGRLATELGDLFAVAGYAAVASGAILAGVAEGPFRVLLAAPLLGFCPGYAVVSAILPRTTPLPWTSDRHPRWRHRAALGVATSVLVLVLAGVALTPTALAPSTVIGTVLAITVLGCLVAGVRRLRAPAAVRPRLPLGRLVADARAATTEAPRADAVLNVALALVVVVAATTLAVGLAAPDRGEDYSEVALVIEDGVQSAVGDDSYVRGDEAALTLEAENRDGTAQSYTAVVVLERFADPPEGGETAALPALLERDELSRTTLTLEEGETTTRSLAFTPSLLGDDLRLSVYVYTGDAPASPSSDSADYHLYRWVDVEDGTGNVSTLAAPSTAAEG